MSEVVKFAKSINLDVDKLLGDWIVCIPGFTLQKYRQLQRSKLSIFSVDCFGSYISNTLGLPFRSPFVNLFMDRQEFLKFLQHPHIYIEDEPLFDKLTGTSVECPNGFPVLSLGNISLNMMHYPKVDESIAKWNERKKRINWYNLFIVTNTDKIEILEQFDELPYGKKVCFVPFKSDLDSAFYIDMKFSTKKRPRLPNVIHHYAQANPPIFYDMFDMLLYGKKTPLIDM